MGTLVPPRCLLHIPQANRSKKTQVTNKSLHSVSAKPRGIVALPDGRVIIFPSPSAGTICKLASRHSADTMKEGKSLFSPGYVA